MSFAYFDHFVVLTIGLTLELTEEILALVAERDAKRIKIDWQFSISISEKQAEQALYEC
jgi:hypothetical protein